MSVFQPTTTDEWVRDQTKKTNLNDRRPRSGRDLMFNGMVIGGLLDPAYRGPGQARVLIDGETTLTTSGLDWLSPYEPWGSRKVELIRVGGTWAILSQTSELTEGGTQRLAFGANWDTYNLFQAESTWADGAFATRLPSGWVHLGGLLRVASGTPASGSIVAGPLPVNMRPGEDVVHFVNNGDTAKAITIGADGYIRARSNWVAGTYVSLDGVGFWAAGVGEWTPVGSGGSTFGANFEQWPDPLNGPVSWWKDPYGFVWFKGLVRVKATTTVDNTNLINMPATHRPDIQQHIRTTGMDAYAGVGGFVSTGLVWKPNSPGTIGNWISLFGVYVVTAEARAGNPYRPIRAYANSWVTYAGAFPTPAIVRRGDGLCMGAGMISTGTLGTVRAFITDREVWPSKGRMILETMANSARARIDLSGVGEIDPARLPGGFCVVNGSNAWTSFDGTKWLPVG